jgi:hypothetical protein
MELKDNYSREEVIGMMKALYKAQESQSQLNEQRLSLRCSPLDCIRESDRQDEKTLLNRWKQDNQDYEATVPLEIRVEIKKE